MCCVPPQFCNPPDFATLFPGLVGPTGPIGATGATGPSGATGPAGARLSSQIQAALVGYLIPASYSIDPSASQSYIVEGVQIAVGSATANVTFTINGNPINGLAGLAVTAVPQTFVASSANSLNIGDILAIIVNSSTGAVGLSAIVSVQ